MKSLHILALIALFSLSCDRNSRQPQSSPHNPSPTTMSKKSPHFDGTKAYELLVAQTNFGPRNPNSTGHKRCLEFLTAELKKHADNVLVQSFSEKGYGETLRLANVFASFNPAEKRRILLAAHWDSRPRAEMDADPSRRNSPILGANDGASGVAVLLELARLFKESPPPVGIDILLTDGEDYGDSEKDGNNNLYFIGAKYFARTKSPSYTPEFGILLDMVGDRDLQIPLEQHSMRYAPAVLDMVWAAAEEMGTAQFIRVPGELVSDDHIPLNEAGIPTIDLIDFQYPYWHTHLDTPDKCSAESLEAVGRVLAHVIYTKLGQ